MAAVTFVFEKVQFVKVAPFCVNDEQSIKFTASRSAVARNVTDALMTVDPAKSISAPASCVEANRQ